MTPIENNEPSKQEPVPSPFENHPIDAVSSDVKLVETSSKYVPDIINLPYKNILYTTLFSVLLFLFFTSRFAINTLEQIPYMYHEGSRTITGGLLSLLLFGFVNFLGNYYIQLQLN